MAPHRLRGSLGFCAAFALFSGQNPLFGGELDDAKRAAAANRDTIEAIHTVQCKVSAGVQENGQPKPAPSGAYWQAGGTSRYRITRPGRGQLDYRIDGGVVTAAAGPVAGQRATVAVHNMNTDMSVNVPYRALFQFFDRGTDTPLYLAELIERGNYSVHAVPRKNAAGEGRLVVKLADKLNGVIREFWLAPERGYLVERLDTADGTDPSSSSSACVERFAEPLRGVHFPAATKFTHRKSTGERVETCLFTEVRVNHHLVAEQLALPFAPGTRVTDKISQKEYTIQPDGSPGPASPLDTSPFPAPINGQQPAVASGRATAEETTHWTAWVLPGAGLVLLFAGALVAAKRWRRLRFRGEGEKA